MSDKPHSQDSAGPLFPDLKPVDYRLTAKNFIPLVPGHFDTPPQNAITADEVRTMRKNGAASWELHRCVLKNLLTHPGVSSAARAVIEAALE